MTNIRVYIDKGLLYDRHRTGREKGKDVTTSRYLSILLPVLMYFNLMMKYSLITSTPLNH